jgi:hypothetical protein
MGFVAFGLVTARESSRRVALPSIAFGTRARCLA